MQGRGEPEGSREKRQMKTMQKNNKKHYFIPWPRLDNHECAHMYEQCVNRTVYHRMPETKTDHYMLEEKKISYTLSRG